MSDVGAASKVCLWEGGRAHSWNISARCPSQVSRWTVTTGGLSSPVACPADALRSFSTCYLADNIKSALLSRIAPLWQELYCAQVMAACFPFPVPRASSTSDGRVVQGPAPARSLVTLSIAGTSTVLQAAWSAVGGFS